MTAYSEAVSFTEKGDYKADSSELLCNMMKAAIAEDERTEGAEMETWR